jgi:Fe2+ or Zn2+ uptake regulation protein
MITNSPNFRELLAAKGIKPTHQRLEILRYLEQHRNHPTADMIYQDLVQAMPTMSKTTVYNTLNSFAESGIVRPVTITGTEVRFDLKTACHHHFLCEECGRIYDIELCCPNLERKDVDGHQVKEIHGYFKGLCAECRRKKKK